MPRICNELIATVVCCDTQNRPNRTTIKNNKNARGTSWKQAGYLIISCVDSTPWVGRTIARWKSFIRSAELVKNRDARKWGSKF